MSEMIAHLIKLMWMHQVTYGCFQTDLQGIKKRRQDQVLKDPVINEMTHAIIVIVGSGGILKSSKYLFIKYEGTETMHQTQ